MGSVFDPGISPVCPVSLPTSAPWDPPKGSAPSS